MIDWGRLTQLGAWVLLPILGGVCYTMLLGVPFSALRWSLLVQIGSTGRLRFLSALRGYFLGLFFNFAMPGALGGDLVRVHFASVRAQIAYAPSALIVLTERLFGLLSLCLLGAIGVAMNDRLGQFTTYPATQVIVWIAAVGAILLVAMEFTRRYIAIPLALVPLILLLSIIGQSTDFLLVYLYGKFLSVDIPLETLLLVMPLVFMASVLPFAPGGHGAREVTLTGLLALVGIPVSQAALIALMLFTTKIGLGLACIGAYHYSNHQLPGLPSVQPK
jgi:uncharacterized membrane protein YbhN (UPF0104 family)